MAWVQPALRPPRQNWMMQHQFSPSSSPVRHFPTIQDNTGNVNRMGSLLVSPTRRDALPALLSVQIAFEKGFDLVERNLVELIIEIGVSCIRNNHELLRLGCLFIGRFTKVA